MAEETFHGTTIVCVRRGGQVAMGGDGQVTLGNVVMKASRAQGAAPLPRPHPRRIRRRDGRCVHALRALRGEAREAPGQPAALGGGAREGLAHGPHAAPARGDARRGRRRDLAPHHGQRRRAGARARDRRHRQRRPLRAGRGASPCSQHTDLAPAEDREASRSRSPATSASTPTRITWSRRSDRPCRLPRVLPPPSPPRPNR